MLTCWLTPSCLHSAFIRITFYEAETDVITDIPALTIAQTFRIREAVFFALVASTESYFKNAETI